MTGQSTLRRTVIAMGNVVLVSCTSKKLDRKAKAEDLYISPLFCYQLAYARTLEPDAIYILSAKHGLIGLTDIVEPYDLTLNEMTSAEVKQWAEMVLRQLRAEANLETDHFVLLAGANYRRYLVPHMASYDVPLEGLGIGKQLQQLKTWLDE